MYGKDHEKKRMKEIMDKENPITDIDKVQTRLHQN